MSDKNDLIVIYVDVDTDISNCDYSPSISMPYRNINEFKKKNEGLKPWVAYSKKHLLEEWGVSEEIESLQKELAEYKEAFNKLCEMGDYYSNAFTEQTMQDEQIKKLRSSNEHNNTKKNN